MESICGAFPIKPGKSDDARAFLRELAGPRSEENAASDRRVGITKEAWFFQSLPTGDVLIGYAEGENLAHSLGQIAASQEPIDRWFKDRVLDITGVDLNRMEGPPSERLYHHEA